MTLLTTLAAQLMETIKHYSNFPATGVSLRQMVQFGSNPSTGMARQRVQVGQALTSSLAQVPYSELLNSFQKSFRSVWPIECKS